MKFKITTDNTPRLVKPADAVIGTVSKNMRNIVELDCQELSDRLAQGQSWTPAVLDGKGTKDKNWVNQQVWALDFDNGSTPEEVIETAAKEGLIINVLHPSFTDTPEKRKFRAIFVLDTIVEDVKLAKAITETLMSVIGKADEVCKNPARLFFGGKSSMVLSTEFNKFSYVLDIVNCRVMGKDNNKVRGIFCPQTASSIVYNRKCGFEPISNNDIESAKNNTLSVEKVRNFDFKELAKEVALVEALVNGVWLEHRHIFGMATSFVRIEGGIKFIKYYMLEANKNGTAAYTPNNFAALAYAEKMNYEPQALRNYSPFEEDWTHFNLITAVRDIRGAVEILESAPKISIIEAENIMKEAFKTAISSKENKITIIKVPTGLGKTEMLKEFVGVVAAPTNDLKEEIYDRVIVPKCKTPDAPIFVDSKLNEEITYLHQINLFKQAASKVHQAISDMSLTQADRDTAKNYMQQLIEAYGSYNTVLTTHTRALNSTFQHKTIVFDECPLQSLMPIKTFNIGDLIQIYADTRNEDVDKLKKVFEGFNLGQLYETPQCDIDFQTLVEDVLKSGEKRLKSDIISALNSDYVIRDSRDATLFHYIFKKDLNKDNNYVILSATAPIEIYEAVFPDRLVVIDVTNVEMVGKVVQHTRKSYSRQSLNATGAIENLLKQLDTELPSITFRETIEKITNAVKEMYFGNTAGYDTLKGQSINVIGTPHLNNSAYMLLGAVANIVLKPQDYVMEFRMVDYGGFRFKFNCYVNERLAALQLSLIEAELIQAVGRARALREDCTVYVYSNLPLSITTNFFNTMFK